jgi:hypothetical protein
MGRALALKYQKTKLEMMKSDALKTMQRKEASLGRDYKDYSNTISESKEGLKINE